MFLWTCGPCVYNILSAFSTHGGICVEFSLYAGLVQKAKKAKDKLLKRDGDDRPDTGSYESFYYGGVDPYMWEPQELGETGKLDCKLNLFVC